MNAEVVRRDDTAGLIPEHRWPERAYSYELFVRYEPPRRVLVDRIAREESDPRALETDRDEFAVDDPFGC